MIKINKTHDDYIQFVSTAIHSLFSNIPIIQQPFSKLIIWASQMNLDSVHSLIKNQYSLNPKGRPPRDPSDLLRSLLLMHKLQYTSIDKWVNALKTIPFYAILSGFSPDNVPGVGTFYDFQKRLWLAEKPHFSRIHKRTTRKPNKKGKKNQKMPPKNPGIVGKLVKRALRTGGNYYSPKAHDLLQSIFKEAFVMKSAQNGQLGNTQHLSICGDGTPVKTGGRSFGKFLCDCRKTGNWKCDCLRQYSDADANWGWDSSREKYYYGRSLFIINAADNLHDLPLYPRYFKASKHDSVIYVGVLHELLHWYPEFTFTESILDSAFDAIPIYELHEKLGIGSIIDLNERNANNFTYKQMEYSIEGIPICPIGREMKCWGNDKERHRTKWRCPAVVENFECPHKCSDSSYGRTVHTTTKSNPRIFTRIRRKTKQWYARYKRRTGIERCIKRQKIDYLLEASNGRSSRHWTVRSYLIAMCQHADAWLIETEKTEYKTIPTAVKELLSL